MILIHIITITIKKMKIIKSKNEIKKRLFQEKSISLVPTMGGIHYGHISLIQKAIKKSKITVVSLYVNPKQFNSRTDYLSYPRNFKNDLNILKKFKIDYVFIPTFKEIYNFKTKHKPFVHKFEKNLCGKFRPKHFKGVIEVVNRLIEIVNPNYLFLGNKDFQQSFLIGKHIKKKNIKTAIINCVTVRDKYGVAYSTRNKNLKKKETFALRNIIKFLRLNKKIFKNDFLNKNKIKYIIEKIKELGATKVDYIEPVKISVLGKKNKDKYKFNLFSAFYINKTRFIDNF